MNEWLKKTGRREGERGGIGEGTGTINDDQQVWLVKSSISGNHCHYKDHDVIGGSRWIKRRLKLKE